VFDPGALTSGLLTGLREGVEAALIVGIVASYLVRTGHRRLLGQVWLGVGGAIALSAALGVTIFLTLGELPAPWEQLFEATMLAVAAGVVTWMLFWMRRASASVSADLRGAIDRAVAAGGGLGLALLAFTAVLREGVETAVFLTGQATAASAAGSGAASVLVGAVAGLLLAVALGVGFYRGSRRLHLPTFFRWTGIALIAIAAGLVSMAAHELVEIGAIPFGTATAYDLSAVLPHQTGVGAFLRALFGYSATPEQTTLALHLGYLVVVLGLYLRPVPAAPVATSAPAPGAAPAA
jgi:high-affinity iron transporter